MGEWRWSSDQEGLDVEKSPHTQLCSSNSSVHVLCTVLQEQLTAHTKQVCRACLCACVHNTTSRLSAVTAISRLHIKILGLRG